jgi:hypothetical protein
MRDNLGYSYPSVDVNLQSGVSVFGCRDTSGFCAFNGWSGVSRGEAKLTADKEGLTIVQTAWKMRLILQAALVGFSETD